MTKKQAEAHLAHLARRRARYAERKKQRAMKTVSWDDEFNGRQPEVIAAFQHAVAPSGMVFVDDPDAHGKIVDTGVLLIAPEVAPTPRAPEQLALPFENRIAQIRPMTPQAREEMEREAKNIGREWIRKIRSIFEEK